MTLQIRRVVTGHDANGRAVVAIDETMTNPRTTRPGASANVIWTTDTIPADNSGTADGAARQVGTTLPGGTVFRVIEFQPGVAPRMHRTDSIDYAVVLSGEIDMPLDDRSQFEWGICHDLNHNPTFREKSFIIEEPPKGIEP